MKPPNFAYTIAAAHDCRSPATRLSRQAWELVSILVKITKSHSASFPLQILTLINEALM